ncbi:response regulator transcription factor [Reinekea blandensis]|uniref:DNA-binding response regulator n=1 Tax=Reinekea blandensis MED297 TaxID=314283 RepID=A4BGK9_9GAMM|nr:response regulator transcription factor [Reinekea blandensis]EAR08815.1 DNA-binding response regulator [Reinekea sp. MED297] [Reinekea blandensis MED297]
MRVLLVEDDTELIARLQARIKQHGYALEVATNGVDGEFSGMELSLDLIILDLGLPGKNGLDVLRHWRASGVETPVLVLTARDAWHERVDGLKAGADDYLGKPFHEEELLARMDALARRRYGVSTDVITSGALTLNSDSQTVTDALGHQHQLTGVEFRLLRYFMMNPDVILSKTRLSEHVYEEDMLRDSNVIEVYINRLRQRFGKSTIVTKRGQGYLFQSGSQP